MNFIAYILSIENSERREHVENLANKLLEKGFKKVEIIDAIYWKEHDVLNILRNLNIKLINSNISRSQIACFLTHRKAWETIITKESNDIHIILEDDMDINSEFSIEKLEDVYGSIERKDYDSIFLYKHPEQISVTNESYNNYLLKHYFQWGLCAYSISPEFAKELYEFIKNIENPIDNQLQYQLFETKRNRIFYTTEDYFQNLGFLAGYKYSGVCRFKSHIWS
jgi:GR25 family glycosyltransferase involved in LPS biosynthesis